MGWHWQWRDCPLHVAATLSPCGYVHGNPLHTSDPSGANDTGCANPNNAKAYATPV
jgi:hypothetical protein